MSYEHCDLHDEPATNGCYSCTEEEIREIEDEISYKLRDAGVGAGDAFVLIRKLHPLYERLFEAEQLLRDL